MTVLGLVALAAVSIGTALPGGSAVSASPQDAVFSALRRADVAAPDQAFVSAVASAVPKALGIDAARTHLVRQIGGEDIYVASGATSICVAEERTVAVGVSRSLACGLLSDLTSGDKAIVGVQATSDAKALEVTALLPDGVRDARLVGPSGTTDVPVVNNIAEAAATGPLGSLTWTTPGGTVARQDLRVLDPTQPEGQ